MKRTFIFIIFSLTISIRRIQASTATSIQRRNPPDEIEAEDGEKTELSFILPSHTDELKNWTIYTPSGIPSCEGKESFLNNGSEYIINCVCKNLNNLNEHCKHYIVTMPKFGSANAGPWIIRRSYEKFDDSGSFLGFIEENDSINVYTIKYDQRYHNTTIEVSEGEYIVIYFREKYSDNTACELHHNEMDNTYDLNEDSYRFPKERVSVQRLGPCGFRMLVRNTSEGNWTLTGQFGWTRQRAAFQILLKSQIHRSTVLLDSASNFLHGDFLSFFFLAVDKSLEYWELQKPDGNIIQPSDISLIDLVNKTTSLRKMYMAVGSPTKNDQGLWKVRAGFQNEAYLREIDVYIIIEDAPVSAHNYERFFNTWDDNGLTMSSQPITLNPPRSCSFKKRNTTFVEGKLEDIIRGHKLFRSCILMFHGESNFPELVEISFDYGDSKVNEIYYYIENEIEAVFHWYSVRPRKYLKLGEELDVKCWGGLSLKKCVLNHVNGTKYIYGESTLLTAIECYDSFGIRKNKSPGYCGCFATIANVTEEHAGNWTCDMDYKNGPKVQSIVQILVMKSHLIPELEIKNDTVKFHCRLFPSMYHDKIGYCRWFLRTGFISTENSTKYNATREDRVCSLQLNDPNENDVGEWTCIGRLHFKGEVNATIYLPEHSIPTQKRKYIGASDGISGIFASNIVLYAIFICIPIVTIGLFIYFCIFEKRRLKKEFDKTLSVRKIFIEITKNGPRNPSVPLHEQLEFLHYDEKRWEYPCKKLSMMKKLGSGHFGIIQKARAPNIKRNGETIEVAVKKTSSTSVVDLRSLIIELKIMASLPAHPNVVNLLGACTRDVRGGGLWMILEFCRYGDLNSYIKKHKSKFTNQIEPITSGKAYLPEETGIRFIRMFSHLFRNWHFRDNRNTSSSSHCNLTIPELSVISYNSDDSPYKAEHPRTLAEPFSTGDLFLWVSQIATGMEFLSKEMVLHGDLALRNVLLTEEKTAKICDFGLSRRIPNGLYHQRINNERPFKISAIESLRDKTYSTKSDVWAFGVLLWECFSLGGEPYDELLFWSKLTEEEKCKTKSEILLGKLLEGFRLEKPEYASEELYGLMHQCWDEEPTQRPSFNDIVAKIEKIVLKNKEISSQENDVNDSSPPSTLNEADESS